MSDWLRRRAIRRAEDRLSDLEYHLSKWGWSMKPSEKLAKLLGSDRDA